MKLNRKLTYEEELVLNLLPKKKPVLTKDIVDRKVIHRITNIEIREISYIISELRKYYPICSCRGTRGYWLGDKEEAQKFANECKKHAEGLLETAKNIESMFDDNLEDLENFEESNEMLVSE